MSLADRVTELERHLANELPGFRVAYKEDSRVQRLLGAVLWPFNRRYLTAYTTVLGRTVWFPSRAWRREVGERTIYEVLRHEAVHLRDARRYPLLFELSYLTLPLPALVTARAWWELRAYRESLAVSLELDGHVQSGQIDAIVSRFVGAEYLFMCPFPKTVRRLLCVDIPADAILDET